MPHLEDAVPGFTRSTRFARLRAGSARVRWMIESTLRLRSGQAVQGAGVDLENERGRIPLMARDLREMFREAFALSESDRATLAGLLIESLEPPPDPEAEELWAAEEERRWREIESGAAETVPWEEVRSQLFRRR